MADMAAVETRLKLLESREAIKECKAKYWRCVDKKLWNEIGDCFAKDIIFERGPKSAIQGREAVVKHLSERLGKSTLITVHQGYAPEIELTGDATARGRWAFADIIIDKDANTDFRGWGLYDDEYVLEGGKWRVKRYGITRLLTENRKRES